MATGTLGAKGTRQYSSKSTRSGTNNSVVTNRMSWKTTPQVSRAAATFKNGSFLGSVPPRSSSGMGTFKAPASMPARLSNLPAVAISSVRFGGSH